MNIHLYVLDTLADWEIAHLTAEVHSRRFFARRDTACRLVTVANTRTPVTTMGGMRIAPDSTLSEIECGAEDLLVLPGGETWMEPVHAPVLELAARRIAADLPVAAICGATVALARAGALNTKHHTSNDLAFLKRIAPKYTGEALYRNLRATSDRNLITASGLGALLFTYEILKALKLFRPDTLEAWRDLCVTNEPRYYYDLLKTLEPAAS